MKEKLIEVTFEGDKYFYKASQVEPTNHCDCNGTGPKMCAMATDENGIGCRLLWKYKDNTNEDTEFVDLCDWTDVYAIIY